MVSSGTSNESRSRERPQSAELLLKLDDAGQTPKSAVAFANHERICETRPAEQGRVPVGLDLKSRTGDK